MNRKLFYKAKIGALTKVLFAALSLIFAFSCFFAETFAQTTKRKPPRKIITKKTSPIAAVNLPKVTQIDHIALQNLIKRDGENQKPLMINFWATWCGPCVEEFPDLVKIDEDYRGKIDFITISMDDLADINTEVPKFLGKMKAQMPAYLLKTDDEEAAINAIAKDWQGALPFTIIYNGKGEISYSKQGKIKPVDVRKEIDRITAKQAIFKSINTPRNESETYTYANGVREAKEDIAKGKLSLIKYGLMTVESQKSRNEFQKEYGIKFTELGCVVPYGIDKFANGYNEISLAVIKKKFGDKVSKLASLK